MSAVVADVDMDVVVVLVDFGFEGDVWVRFGAVACGGPF